MLVIDDWWPSFVIYLIPKWIIQTIPKQLGENIFAGILRRAGQPILVVREVLSWFTTAAIIENKKAETLRESLIT